jgi:putative ABC transport system ATP-binding protein
MVTHDLTVAKLADRVIEVLDGKIINAEEGTLLDSKIELNN